MIWMRSWMSGVAVEEMPGLWASSLRDVKSRMPVLFTPGRVAASAGQCLDGRRKAGWLRAEAAGDKGPWRQRAILGRVPREADALRDILCTDPLATLADPDAVLVREGAPKTRMIR